MFYKCHKHTVILQHIYYVPLNESFVQGCYCTLHEKYVLKKTVFLLGHSKAYQAQVVLFFGTEALDVLFLGTNLSQWCCNITTRVWSPKI